MKKQPNIIRKRIFINIIVCCILVSLLYYLYHTYIPECDNYDSGLGWSCSISGVEKIPSITKKILEKRCETDKGESKIGHMLPSTHEYFSCRIPYSDAGKPCKNSSECKGCCEHTGSIPPDSCIGDEEKYTCSYDLYGRCSKEFSFNCDYLYEVRDNTIYKYKRQRILIQY